MQSPAMRVVEIQAGLAQIFKKKREAEDAGFPQSCGLGCGEKG